MTSFVGEGKSPLTMVSTALVRPTHCLHYTAFLCSHKGGPDSHCSFSTYVVGNKRFRSTITNSLEEYSKAETRVAKSLVVLSIFDGIRTHGGRFLKKDEQGQWYELSDQQTKHKIAHAVRDAVNSNEARRAGKKMAAQQKVEPAPSPTAYTTEHPPMESDSSESHLPSQRQPLGSADTSARSGSSFYQNLEAVTRDPSLRRHSQTAAHPFGFLPARSVSNPFGGVGPQPYYSSSPAFAVPGTGGGTSEIGGGETVLGSQPRGYQTAGHSTATVYGQERPYASHHAPRDYSQAQRLSQGPARFAYPQPHGDSSLAYQQYAMPVAAPVQPARPLGPAYNQQPQQPQQHSPTDPFLDQINEVLGPLGSEERSDHTISRITGAAINLEMESFEGKEDEGDEDDSIV